MTGLPRTHLCLSWARQEICLLPSKVRHRGQHPKLQVGWVRGCGTPYKSLSATCQDKVPCRSATVQTRPDHAEGPITLARRVPRMKSGTADHRFSAFSGSAAVSHPVSLGMLGRNGNGLSRNLPGCFGMRVADLTGIWAD